MKGVVHRQLKREHYDYFKGCLIRQFQGADNSAHFKVGPVQSGYENNSLISIFMYSQHFLGFTNNMLLTSVLPGNILS